MRRIWQVALLLGLCASAQAQDISLLYKQSEVERVANIYGPNLQGLWEEDFLSRLTREERSLAGAVKLNLPLVDAKRHPLNFYSDPTQKQVFLPISSVKFMDDMAVSIAYYEKMGCELGTVTDYVAALRFQPQNAKGSPLDTLGVPRGAINDPFVNDLSQKVLKSAVYFIAAHEYAHVMYRHKYRNIKAEEAQRQETEADAFALEVMRRIGVPPLGMVYYFLILSRLEASPGDFCTIEEYEAYLREHATHPVSSARILKVAEGIESNIIAFSRLESNPAKTEKTLRTIIPQLRQIGSTLDDRAMRRYLADRARTVDMSALRHGCRQ